MTWEEFRVGAEFCGACWRNRETEDGDRLFSYGIQGDAVWALEANILSVDRPINTYAIQDASRSA
jgi:hypothetical protein